MRRVILESPYAGNIATNTAYAREALRHSLSLGEAPIASHLLYTQVLDDTIAAERQLGIDAGLAWRSVAEASMVYCDLGVSPGMRYGITAAIVTGLPIIARWLHGPRPGWTELEKLFPHNQLNHITQLESLHGPTEGIIQTQPAGPASNPAK